jgi:type II secretory pathway component PulM
VLILIASEYIVLVVPIKKKLSRAQLELATQNMQYKKIVNMIEFEADSLRKLGAFCLRQKNDYYAELLKILRKSNLQVINFQTRTGQYFQLTAEGSFPQVYELIDPSSHLYPLIIDRFLVRANSKSGMLAVFFKWRAL